MIIIDQIKQTKNQQPYNFYLFPFESSIVLCSFFEIHEKVFVVLVALAFATYLRTISNIVICSDQAFITVFQGVISKSYFLFPFSLAIPFEYRFSYYKFTLYHASKYSHCMFMVKVCQDSVILLIQKTSSTCQLLTFRRPMFRSYRNQSVDLLAFQLTGFYMMGTLVVKRLNFIKSGTSKHFVLLLNCLTIDLLKPYLNIRYFFPENILKLKRNSVFDEKSPVNCFVYRYTVFFRDFQIYSSPSISKIKHFIITILLAE